MRKALSVFCFLGIVMGLYGQRTAAQSLNDLLQPQRWAFEPGSAEFSGTGTQRVMKITENGKVVRLKDIAFSSGVIEYDVQLQERGFASIYFRMQDLQETECFYLRGGRAGDPVAMDAIQYAPFLKGVNLWDLLPQYQAAADLYANRPNHIKLVVSGKKMRVYVNDMQQPALLVPQLEGNTGTGALAFDGKVTISHLKIRENDTEGLTPDAGMDLTLNDPRYLRKWMASTPIDFAAGRDLTLKGLPDSTMQWQPVAAERGGLVNLTRFFGGGQFLNRQLIWLKTVLNVPHEQKLTMDLGFSDEVWVFLNGKMVYVDKNLYLEGPRKKPDGRLSIENAGFQLPLQAGTNELLIGIANNFYGWGIIARLGSMEGITVK
ncbi:hypothetical protein [Niabella drilacis]|uniref:3-keto-disaccharide hydrolase domain-containing protein n=1 Tax=Niabella drilacis (strain DSM 25811 / CCM 8410 / CCUG 62505 / LMG 26954 / E90) TaxID=1285928 RepID=A0A1G6NGB0_NIADE|nr:hypothetical protein [Niabella drilacis]SDC66862.1 hypothetical protein SAMN04487894_103265 [Niabella drilacis]